MHYMWQQSLAHLLDGLFLAHFLRLMYARWHRPRGVQPTNYQRIPMAKVAEHQEVRWAIEFKIGRSPLCLPNRFTRRALSASQLARLGNILASNLRYDAACDKDFRRSRVRAPSVTL